MDKPTRKPPAQRGQLNRTLIVEAGLAIVRVEGLDRLTMRRLAAQLGVEAMSLYNHVRDKRDLLDGLASQALAAIPHPDPAQPWTRRLEAVFFSLYEAFSADPWLVTVLTAEEIEPSGREVLTGMEVIIGVLEDAGLAPAQRVNAFRGMLALCFGLVLTHTLGLRASPAAALERFGAWDADKWRDAGVPRLAALAPQFLATKPGDDVRFMFDGYLAAIARLKSDSAAAPPEATR